jgi:hypothetical protein
MKHIKKSSSTSATAVLLEVSDVVSISGGMVLTEEQAAERAAARECEPAAKQEDSPLRRQIVMA